MAKPKISDEILLHELKTLGSPKRIAEKYGMAERQVHKRRQNIEKRLGLKIPAFADRKITTISTLVSDNKRIVS